MPPVAKKDHEMFADIEHKNCTHKRKNLVYSKINMTRAEITRFGIPSDQLEKCKS